MEDSEDCIFPKMPSPSRPHAQDTHIYFSLFYFIYKTELGLINGCCAYLIKLVGGPMLIMHLRS